VKGYYSKLDVVAVVKFDDKLNARRSSLSKEVKMPRVSYFAVPADNPERATKFYRQVFGWNFELGWEYDTPKGRESYWHIKTEHRDESGINGGLTRREYLDQPIGIGVEVTGIEEMLARIEQCGGKILVGKNALQNARLWLALCKDSEGNTFAMFEVDEAIQSSA